MTHAEITESDETAAIGPRRPGRWLYPAVTLFFFVSGACGLLYQIVWTRKLVLLFGTTSYAVSTVLAIFFLGLALGAWAGGRAADRAWKPLAIYGWLEILVGIWAFAFILLIDRGESLAVSWLQAAPGNRVAAIGIRAILSAGLLIVPVTLMGATLPLLARFVTTQETVGSGRIGGIYSINTFGAVAGCLVTGFFLIAEFGYTQTTKIGAAANIVVGILALIVSVRVREQEFWPADEEPEADPAAPAPDDLAEPEPIRVPLTRSQLAVAAAFFVSGFAALGLEVLWTRLLIITFKGTTYAFTAVLASMLLGIALGSILASLFVDRIRKRLLAYGFVQTLTGAACLLTLSAFPGLHERYVDSVLLRGGDWDTQTIWMFVHAFTLLALPTILFGMSFPFVVRAAARNEEFVGHDVGRLYAANTLGGVTGSLIAGFILITTLGAHRSIVLLSAALALSGFLLCWLDFRRAPLRTAVLAPAAAALTVAAWFGAPADVGRVVNEWFIPEGHEMLHYAEGIEGTVVVSGPADVTHESDRYLWINAIQATASIDKGVRMNRFQGALPLFFDRPMKDALFIGCGSGITAGTLALSPFDRIDAVEISREVIKASPYFAEANFRVFENERVNFIIDDGRNFLLTSEDDYDLIMFEPMPLAIAGVSTFYTTEYYELCKDHLTETGIVSQWIPLHNGLPESLIRDLVATFIAVFPECNAWFINADLFLVGSNQPLKVDYRLLQERLEAVPQLREGLAESFLPDIPELLACYLTGRDGLETLAEGGRLMSDDRPWAEFMAPRLIGNANVPDMLRVIQPLHRSPTECVVPGRLENWRDALERLDRRYRAHQQDMRAQIVYYESGPMGYPERDFRVSLEIDPNDANAKYYLSDITLAQGQVRTIWDELELAVDYLKEGLQYTPERPELWLALGNAYHKWEKPEEAAQAYRRYIELGGTADIARERANLPD